jgi:CheY-like chemotaxis protein
LIVDDAAVVRSVLGQALFRSGCAVWTAAEGQQAIDLYRQHGAEIDLVVLDVQMPGLDGVQTLEALRTINSNVRCCFLTGGSTAEEELLSLGAVEVILKPAEPEAIVEALQRLLAGARHAV